MQNKVEALVELVGSQASLARAIRRDPSLITRYRTYGKLPPQHNATMREYVTERSTTMGREWAERVLALLEPDVCPTCGQEIPQGMVL